MRGQAVLIMLLACAGTAQALDWWAADLPGHSTETVYSGTIVATNTGTSTETVTIYQGGSATVVATLSVPSLDSATWQMPVADRIDFSQQGTRGVYRVETSDRVIVATFHPIDNSPKNDALALMDEERLGTDHHVITFSTSRADATCREASEPNQLCRNFVTVVGTQAGTSVTVTPKSAVTSGGSVPAIAAGTPYTTTLGRGEFLHVEADDDLTGSTVTSSHPVAVFSGVACLGIAVSSCDQVSEQILPDHLLGREHLVCTPAHHWGNMDEIRVVAVNGPTTVTVTPGGTYTIAQAGDFAEFTITDHVLVSATDNVIVGQFYRQGSVAWQGDPSLLVQPATGLYLDSLSFVSPRGDGLGRPAWTTFAYLQGPASASVTVDGGAAVALTEAVPGTPYGCARISPGYGTHHLKSTEPISVQVFGLASPTTYAYNGFGVFTTDFTATTVCAGDRTTFTDQSTQKRSLKAWSWDFGDGSTGTGPTTDHRYRAPGSYAVSMDTTDNWGRQRTVTHKVDVLFCNEAPTVYPYDVSEHACRPLRFHIPATDPDGHQLVYTYTWPGKPAGVTLQGGFVDWSAYAAAGTYGPITVNVTDPYGWGDEGTFMIERMACPDEERASNADADGDGTPDGHDPCPSDGQDGCVPRACDGGRVHTAEGARDTTGWVRVNWTGSNACGVFLVFNATGALLARVAEPPWQAEVEGTRLFVQWSPGVAPLDRSAVPVTITCCVAALDPATGGASQDSIRGGTSYELAPAPDAPPPQDTPLGVVIPVLALAVALRRR